MKTHNLSPHIQRTGKPRRKAAKPAPVELPETFSIGWPPGFVSQFAPAAPMKNIPKRGQTNGFDRTELNLPGAIQHTSRWKNQFTKDKP